MMYLNNSFKITTMSDNHKIYQAIVAFISDLNDGFGKRYKSVALYNRLLSRVQENNDAFIQRNIDAFKGFFENNREYIATRQLSSNPTIRYSENVYLNMENILKRTDEESHGIIYQHLATICAMIYAHEDRGKQAMENLKSAQQDIDEEDILSHLELPDTKEGQFLKDTLGMMTSQIDHNNPMGSVMSMMQSGFFNNFMNSMKTNMESGEIDVNGLIGTVTGMLNNTVQKSDGLGDSPLNGMLQSAISQLNGQDGISKDNLKELEQLNQKLSTGVKGTHDSDSSSNPIQQTIESILDTPLDSELNSILEKPLDTADTADNTTGTTGIADNTADTADE